MYVLSLCTKDGAVGSTDSVEKDDLPSVSDRSPTPLLSLGKSQQSEEATNTSVLQKQGSEKQTKEVVETDLVAQATGAVLELPLLDEDRLGEPATQNIKETVDPDNNADI